MKRIFTVFLALLMILSALPMASLQVYATEEETTSETDLPVQISEAPDVDIPAQEALPKKDATPANIVASGSCGEALTWVLDDAGVLTISGTGPMTDFPASSPSDQIPWREHWVSIKKVIIADGVTTVGIRAFINCENLTEAILPGTITSIGTYAFYKCSALTNIQLPEGITFIGEQAFAYCTSLTEIILPNSLTTIQRQLFMGCTSLKSAVLGNNVSTIKDGVFSSCTSLTAMTLPDSLTTLDRYIFNGCESLASINIPDGITVIPNELFSKCSSLTSISLPDSVTCIDSYAFYACTELTTITLGNSVQSIDNDAFSCCSKLKNIELPDSLDLLGSGAFNQCRSLEEICIPDNVSTIESFTFSNCTSLVNITLPAKLTRIEYKAFIQCTSIKSIVFPEGLTEIGRYAFNGCESLETIWIPLSFKKDGEASLATCPLKDIYYPGSSKQFRSISFDRLVPDFRETATFHFGIPDLVPPIVRLVNNAQTGLQELTWEPVEDAVSYEIYRAKNTNGPFTLVADIAETSWRDSSAALGKTFYYQVKAIHEDRDRSSTPSQPVRVTYTCGNPVISVATDAKGKPKLSWAKISSAKKYTVYRTTSETGKYTKLGTTTKTYYTDSKAKSGTTYFYKVIANGSKSSYNSGYSNIVSCGVICGAPSVSVNVDANTGKPTLSWKKVDAATGYVIYRDGELLTTVTAVTYADTTAAIDTQYSYAVQALGKTEDLNGSLSKAVSATSGIAKPAAKGSVDTVSGKPVITWRAVEGAVKYEIYRSTKSSKSYKLVATVETLTYGDDAFAAGTAYYYKVKAIGAVSKSAESSYVKLTGKCATPVISAEAGQSGKPKISWEKVTGAKQYTVYRATSENGKYSKLGTTKSNTYEDKKASVGKTYFYKVIANGSKSSGNSAYSNIVSCSVRLAAPKIKSYGPNDVYGDPLISWEKVSGAKGYRILRKLPGETEFKVIKEWNETYFRDMDAPLFAECTYIMQTIGSKPEYDSVYTEEMTILSTMGQPNVTCLSKNNGASLTWYAVEGAVSYDVFVSDTKDGAFTLLLNTKSTGYLHTDAQPNRDYYYKVVAIGESGLRVEGYVNKLCIRCATPRVTLELDAVSGKPVLSWEAVDGATKGYEIYRATSGGKLKKLKTVKTLRFIDTSATPGGDYRYEVRALGSGKDYNSKWEETGYIAAKCAQPKATVKLNKSGDPVVSWKKVSGAKQYMVMYVDVTDFVLSGTEPSESYLQQHMQYVQTSKTSVTLTKAESDRAYIITMIAVPKNQECFSTPSDPVIVITE